MIREKHVGISELGKLTRKKLRELDHALIVHYRTTPEPAAVLVPYWYFIRVQHMLIAARELMNEEEAK